KLKFLLITKNEFAVLPAEICKLNSLEELDFGYNNISIVPTEIGRLGKLKRLVGTKNNISKLPSEMIQMGKLEIVDFAYNQFSDIPTPLMEVRSLKAVDLSFNKGLGNFASDIRNLQALRILNLKETLITPAQVEDLTWLIADCKITL
ncbi:MAG: hypothetical protein JST49_16405, partial [Bacteroidetes bacterium]|nr:hypothetical protein [Bacteroidota bacterium]